MAENFSIGISGLSGRAQKFVKENIDNGDGVIDASERKMLAEYLNGTRELSNEYSGVREELEEFGRYFDVEAASSELFVEEAEDVAISCQILGKDANAIDCDKDYLTAKEYADGKRGTPKEQAYARALLERSSYARERMAKEEGAKLQEQNRALLAENTALKAQLSVYETKAKDTKGLAEEVLDELSSMDTKISDKCKNPVENILSSSNEIINIVKKSSGNPKETIENLKKCQNEITAEKAKGRAVLEEIASEQTQDKQVQSQSTSEAADTGTNAAGAAVGSIAAKATTQSVSEAGIAILRKLFSDN